MIDADTNCIFESSERGRSGRSKTILFTRCKRNKGLAIQGKNILGYLVEILRAFKRLKCSWGVLIIVMDLQIGGGKGMG